MHVYRFTIKESTFYVCVCIYIHVAAAVLVSLEVITQHYSAYLVTVINLLANENGTQDR